MRLAAKLPSNGKQVRLMRFEEPQQRAEKRRIVKPTPKLVRPDSGQVEEPLRPAVLTKRCRKRGKGKRGRVRRRVILVSGLHSLQQ